MKQKLFILLVFFSEAMFAQWETVYFPTTGVPLPRLNAVEFYDFDDGFAVGAFGFNGRCILRTFNNGTNWDTVYSAMDTSDFIDITFLNSTTSIAVGGKSPDSGVIAITNDFGISWSTTITNTYLYSESFPNDSTGYVSGYLGTVLKTTNGGNSWLPLNTGISCSLYSIFFISNNIGFASGKDTIIKTTDGGINWTSKRIALGNGVNSIYFVSDSIGYCKSGCDTNVTFIYKTIDQGNTWQLQSTIQNANCLTSMHFTDLNTGYITGQFDLLKSIDGGVHWNSQTASPPGWLHFYDDLNDVFFLNQDTGFAVGQGQFYRTVSGGIMSVDEQSFSYKLIVYPNPFSIEVTLKTDRMFKDATLILNNSFGQKVKQIKGLNGQSVTIPRDNLSSGLYYMRLIQNNQTIAIEKLVIEDN